MSAIKNAIYNFAREEDGAQVVEYALIIAVVSIGLVAALGTGSNNIAENFTGFLLRVQTCLTGTSCT